MRKIVFLILFTFVASCLPAIAQYSVTGIAPSIADGTVITLIGYDAGIRELPKAEMTVKDGRFFISVDEHINDVANMVISSDDGTLKNFLFKMRNDQVTVSLDHRGKPHIQGSHEQDAVYAYIEMSILAHKLWGGDPREDSQWPEFAIQDSLFVPYCEKYGDTQQAVQHISDRRKYINYPYSRCMRLLQYVDTAALAGNNIYKELLNGLSIDKQWEPGHKFTYPLDGTAPDGRRWGVGDFKGKYTLIVVSSSKCKGNYYQQTLACRKALYTQLKALGYEEYDWMMADTQENVNLLAKNKEIPWVIVAPVPETMKEQYKGLMAQDNPNDYRLSDTYFYISPEGDILIHEKDWVPVKEKILETFKNIKLKKTKKRRR